MTIHRRIPRATSGPSGPLVPLTPGAAPSLVRQMVGTFLDATLSISNATFTDILRKTGGASLNVTFAQARLPTSLVLVVITANFSAGPAPRSIRFKCLIDGAEPQTTDGGFPLTGSVDFEADRAEQNSGLAIHALLPPALLPAASAHLFQPQVSTLEGTAIFDTNDGFGGFAITVAEIIQ